MNYLLDTNHCSHLQRKDRHDTGQACGAACRLDPAHPVVAQAELLAGVETLPNGQRKQELRRLYDATVQEAVEIPPIDSRVAERFAAIFAQLRRSVTPIETNDIGVGAIALVHDLTVATSDVHLRYIAGLRVEDWTSR